VFDVYAQTHHMDFPLPSLRADFNTPEEPEPIVPRGVLRLDNAGHGVMVCDGDSG
jgi:hypothetical protein